ncbi:MAG: DUF3422 family protein [Sphingomonadaceae bacterium]
MEIAESQFHPLRAELAAEMHLRKLPPLEPGVRMAQIVMVPEDERSWAETDAHLAALCEAAGKPCDPASRFFRVAIGNSVFIWERHTEFASFTFSRVAPEADPFGEAPFADLPPDWLGTLPRGVLRATRIAFVGGREAGAEAGLGDDPFRREDLVCCDIAGGRARIWSDFRLHEDGFGRLLIADKGLSGLEAALSIQRVQELGNYRNMALLGLPVAQGLTPEVSRLEQRLAALTADIAGGSADDEKALDELSFLSAELARLMAETRYRMSATKAYADIVADRLRSLKVVKVEGHQTLADFTERRLAPATRTCASFSARLEDLSRRVNWTSDLMRTRVETAVSEQSRDLLASMNRRTHLQLRLQQTVEGLSIVAISYYAVGLIAFIVAGIETGIDEELVVALAVPPVVLVVWLAVLRLRRKVLD